MHRTKKCAAILLPVLALEIGGLAPAFAQSPVARAAAAAAVAAPPENVTVTATRGIAIPIDRTAATVSVITGEELEDRDAKDVKDALRYEPGVDVRRQAYRPAGISAANGRAGNEGINVRGLEGNRVLMLEDGIALPQSFAFGSDAATISTPSSTSASRSCAARRPRNTAATA